MFRKAAFKMVSENVNHVEINTRNLKDFVGQPIFTHDRLYESTPPGVVMGLAWTAMGGSALYIETVTKKSIRKGKDTKDTEARSTQLPGGLDVTGTLGDVMKVSGMLLFASENAFH